MQLLQHKVIKMTKEEAKKFVETYIKAYKDGYIPGPITKAKLKKALKILFSKNE